MMYIPIDEIKLVVEKYRQSFNEATNENSTEAPKVDKPINNINFLDYYKKQPIVPSLSRLLGEVLASG